jgi:hypothetical protein
MSSSSTEEIGIDDVTQEILEQLLVVKFNYPRRRDGLQIRTLIICLLGFGVVLLVSISHDEA